MLKTIIIHNVMENITCGKLTYEIIFNGDKLGPKMKSQVISELYTAYKRDINALFHTF